MRSLQVSRQTVECVKHKRLGPFSLALCVLISLIISKPSSAEWVANAEAHMGTEISVYLWHDDSDSAEAALKAIFSEMSRLDALLSTYKDDSEITHINNQAAEQPVATSDEVYFLLQRALDMSVLTKGAFDITFDSVGQHYDFRERERPDEETLSRELPLIDYRRVILDERSRTVFFEQPGVRINLGGIAKGYAVERGIEIAREHGVEHARVTAGGDTRLLGDRQGAPWLIGVQDPRNEDRVAITLPMVDEAISTSGDYERYFIEDGERYHHIITPSTGRPAGELNSVTIIGPDAVITDALSTSVFIMGLENGLRLISTLPDYEGIVINAEREIFYSDGLQTP